MKSMVKLSEATQIYCQKEHISEQLLRVNQLWIHDFAANFLNSGNFLETCITDQYISGLEFYMSTASNMKSWINMENSRPCYMRTTSNYSLTSVDNFIKLVLHPRNDPSRMDLSC